MWTIQGHDAFENAQGHGGRHCPPLTQAMSIKNKGVLKVGVPSIQDLQKWAACSCNDDDDDFIYYFEYGFVPETNKGTFLLIVESTCRARTARIRST